jgi:hypothetical protein
MKRILIALVILAVGCKKSDDMVPAECTYTEGDIVYLKLDSTKCIIKYVYDYTEPCSYYIKYVDDSGRYQGTSVEEFEITL